MQEDDDLLDRMNKVKAVADKFACLEAPVRNKNTVMTLLEILLPSYRHMITGLEMMSIKELTVEYMMACFIHEMLTRKDKESQDDDDIIK